MKKRIIFIAVAVISLIVVAGCIIGNTIITKNVAESGAAYKK